MPTLAGWSGDSDNGRWKNWADIRWPVCQWTRNWTSGCRSPDVFGRDSTFSVPGVLGCVVWDVGIHWHFDRGELLKCPCYRPHLTGFSTSRHGELNSIFLAVARSSGLSHKAFRSSSRVFWAYLLFSVKRVHGTCARKESGMKPKRHLGDSESFHQTMKMFFSRFPGSGINSKPSEGY
jgi:hypothetical protein